MIIFATHHDDSTAESIKLAKSIIEENDIALLKDDAIKIRLLPILETNAHEQLMIF